MVFRLKAHIGVDAKSGWFTPSAKVHDARMTDDLISTGLSNRATLGQAQTWAGRAIFRAQDRKARYLAKNAPQPDGATFTAMSDGTRYPSFPGRGQPRNMCYLRWPRNIGSPEALVLVSGPQDVFDDAKPFLDALAGDLRYTGANIRGACALDLAYLSRLTANIFGTIHGAYLCESEGVPVQKLADLLPDGDRGQYLIEAMQNDFDVSGGGATVDVAWAAVSRIAMQANDAGINSEFPDLLASLAERARAAGYGAQETAAIIKVLRAHEKS